MNVVFMSVRKIDAEDVARLLPEQSGAQLIMEALVVEKELHALLPFPYDRKPRFFVDAL
jgi:hypothetical protein